MSCIGKEGEKRVSLKGQLQQLEEDSYGQPRSSVSSLLTELGTLHLLPFPMKDEGPESQQTFWFRFLSDALRLMTETKEKNRGMALKWTCCQPGLYSHLGGCSRAHTPRSYCKKFQSCLERLVSSVTEAVGCNFLLLKKSKALL